MATSGSGRFGRCCRKFFRCLRISVLLFAVAALGALLYLNRVGLPDFLKEPLLEKLRARGLDLQFSRLRWRPGRGLVAENVRFGSAAETPGPALAAKEMQLLLHYPALVKRQFQVRALLLKQARFTWPVVETNGPPRELSVENIQTELHLLPDDLWALDDFQAQFAGARIQLTGTITNASALRGLKIFQGRPAPPGTLQNRLRQWADTLEQIHFAEPPQLRMDFRGDARDLPSFALRLALDTPDAETPWGTVEGARFSALLSPATGEEWGHAEINLQAASARTRWATTTDLALAVHLYSTHRGTNVVGCDLNLSASSVETRWGGGSDVHFNAHWQHALTNAIPLSGHGELQLIEADTAWGGAREVQFTANLSPATNAPPTPDPAWAWWTNLAPHALEWECRVNGLESPKLQAEEVVCSGQWQPPELKADRIFARLYRGQLDARAGLDVATREVTFNAASDFDIQKTAPLLTPRARDWLAQYSWAKAPDVNVEGGVVLPAWTNLFSDPDWRGEVQPTLRLNGQFHVENGAFRGVPASTADSHFTYSNMVWRLPDLAITRPEGRVDLFQQADDRTKEYYFRIHSSIDVRIFRPLLEPKQQREFDRIEFTQPPLIDGEIKGRWRDYERIHARMRVAATNFVVRGEPVSGFQSLVEYTNLMLTLIEPRAQQGTQELSASSMILDFAARKIYLTNGFGTGDPAVITRAISPKVAKIMEPYRFLQPPTVRAEGVIPMRDERDADLHFVIIDGPQFYWWKLWTPHITGKVDWVGDRLTLSDVRADFYRGKAAGSAEFTFVRDQEGREHRAHYRFDFVATDADVHLLANDLSDKPNKLEGRLTLRLGVTHARSDDWQSCTGNGRANLRDGLIWDIPIFGILSPVLDTVMPGLGRSRAREGSATFTITNGVVRSDDLEIQTAMARLRYWGTIDLKGAVDARADAELLRNLWGVGPVLSAVLWPVSKVFEFKIFGTVLAPKTEPVYLPKILLLPIRPIQTLKELFPEAPNPSTNAPPPAN